MTNKIHSAFDKIEASQELKSSTMEFLRAEREKRRPRNIRTVWMKTLVPVCAVLLFLVGLGAYHSAQTPVSYVSIDVNPSVELTLNRYDRVIEAAAYNADGKMVLDSVKVKGKYYMNAINAIVESEAMQPYLTGDSELTFTVAAKDDEKESVLMTSINNCSGTQKHGGQSYTAEVDSIREAHEHDLSFGKYAAYRELSKYDNTVTAAECHDMTMAEIHSRIEQHESEKLHDRNDTEIREGNSSEKHHGESEHGTMSKRAPKTA